MSTAGRAARREFMMVLGLALAGVGLAGVVALAPWQSGDADPRSVVVHIQPPDRAGGEAAGLPVGSP